jgi:hypothetical protein
VFLLAHGSPWSLLEVDSVHNLDCSVLLHAPGDAAFAAISSR